MPRMPRITELKVKRYQTEVNNISRYRTLIRELEQDGGATIAAAEQAFNSRKRFRDCQSQRRVPLTAMTRPIRAAVPWAPHRCS